MTTRKDFLAASAAIGALAPQITLADAAPSPSAAPETPMPPLDFDLAAFNESLDKRGANHKHMFGSKHLSRGDIFANMSGTLFAYKSLNVPLSDVALAGVFYHGFSVYLGFDDFIWKKYVIPGLTGTPKPAPEMVSDVQSVKPHDNNPCLHKSGGSDDQSIEALVEGTGMRLYVCNRATSGLAKFAAQQRKLDPVAVYKDFVAHLVPNAMLTPSGIWALHAIEERGYTYCAVS